MIEEKRGGILESYTVMKKLECHEVLLCCSLTLRVWRWEQWINGKWQLGRRCFWWIEWDFRGHYCHFDWPILLSGNHGTGAVIRYVPTPNYWNAFLFFLNNYSYLFGVIFWKVQCWLLLFGPCSLCDWQLGHTSTGPHPFLKSRSSHYILQSNYMRKCLSQITSQN